MAHVTRIMFPGASGLSVSQTAPFASTPQQCRCSRARQSMLPMPFCTWGRRPMAAMGNLKRRPTRLAATVLGRTATVMMMALDAGGGWCWPGGRTTLSVRLSYLQVQLLVHFPGEQTSHNCEWYGEKCEAADQTQRDLQIREERTRKQLRP
jgi:hypothetical protein